MAAAVDASLLPEITSWTERAYKVLGEMVYRENIAAKMYQSELQQLQSHLDQLLNERSTINSSTTDITLERGREGADHAGIRIPSVSQVQSWGGESMPSGWNYELSAEQLISFADALDIESLAWPSMELRN